MDGLSAVPCRSVTPPRPRPPLPDPSAPRELVAEIERLSLRRLAVQDAPFMLEVLTDPAFMRFVGDRGVRTVADAQLYLIDGALKSYEVNGFGLYAVERRADGAFTGICGLVRRPGLEDVDLGFAFLPAFRGLGYATEAGGATLAHAWRDRGLSRVVAITDPANAGSIHVLEKLGFAFERRVSLTPSAETLNLYAIARPARD